MFTLDVLKPKYMAIDIQYGPPGEITEDTSEFLAEYGYFCTQFERLMYIIKLIIIDSFDPVDRAKAEILLTQENFSSIVNKFEGILHYMLGEEHYDESLNSAFFKNIRGFIEMRNLIIHGTWMLSPLNGADEHPTTRLATKDKKAPKVRHKTYVRSSAPNLRANADRLDFLCQILGRLLSVIIPIEPPVDLNFVTEQMIKDTATIPFPVMT